MSYQWSTAQSTGEETKIALDLTDFPAWDSCVQNLSGDELSQLFVEPQPDYTPDYTAIGGMDFTSWEWNGLSNPSDQSYMQVSQLQSTDRDQNLSLDKDQDLKQVVSELRSRLDKYEESIDIKLIQLEKRAVEQEKRVESRITKVEQMLRDLQNELEEERAGLRVELQAWAEQVRNYVDIAMKVMKTR